MRRLKATFDEAGMTNVATYINSGNVVFTDRRKAPKITEVLERSIANEFGFEIKVLVRDLPAIRQVMKALPDWWTNDAGMRCDVMFLWEKHDREAVLEELPIKPEIEDVKYVAGAVLWRIDRENVMKSRMYKVVGTDLYQGMTIRNCNTVRKLSEMMEAVDERTPAGGRG
jgi:uncharacterized protein (DUF1697 family)